MEQLTRIADIEPTTLIASDVHNRIARVLRKVTIQLSRQQMLALSGMIQYFLINTDITTLEDSACYFLVFTIWEKKVRRNLQLLKPKLKLSLNQSEAWAISFFCDQLDLRNYPYEDSVRWNIIGTINQQTL